MLWGSESAEAVPDGRRERKKSRTRQDLVEAATKLFAAQGFSNTTVEEITELADVSVRTFFRHFASKEEVLFPQRYHTDALLSAVADQPEASSDLRAIRDAFISLLTFDEAGNEHCCSARPCGRTLPWKAANWGCGASSIATSPWPLRAVTVSTKPTRWPKWSRYWPSP